MHRGFLKQDKDKENYQELSIPEFPEKKSENPTKGPIFTLKGMPKTFEAKQLPPLTPTFA
jgi:hypothetical protein